MVGGSAVLPVSVKEGDWLLILIYIVVNLATGEGVELGVSVETIGASRGVRRAATG